MWENLSFLQRLMLLGIVPPFITCLIGIVLFLKKRLDDTQKFVFMLAICSTTANFINTYLWYYQMSNAHISNVYVLFGTLLIVQIYRQAGTLSKQFSLIISGAFGIFWVVNAFFIQGFYEHNSYTATVYCILPICFASVCFYKMLINSEMENVLSFPIFWINVGMMVYFATSIFIFTFSDYLLKYSLALNVHIWFVHSIFLGLFFVFLSIGLCIRSPKLA
ncbi:MAG: hypothetical protein EAZ95_12780 [Bacteroidetes bacterium]|nr:MAG: hypothetical protein EAZ95_12780 [Bacteroidota bacterium]